MKNRGNFIEKLKGIVIIGLVVIGGLYASATSEIRSDTDFQSKTKTETNQRSYAMKNDSTTKIINRLKANKGKDDLGQ